MLPVVNQKPEVKVINKPEVSSKTKQQKPLFVCGVEDGGFEPDIGRGGR